MAWRAVRRARAAAELAQDAPGFELGIGALAGSAQPGMSPAGLFLRGGLVPPPARREALTGTTAHAVLFTFRLQVRHQIQEFPAVFLPVCTGDAARRFVADRCARAAGEAQRVRARVAEVSRA